MTVAEYLSFLAGAGWLATLMIVAMLPGLRSFSAGRHLSWLLAFCIAQALVPAGSFLRADSGTVRTGVDLPLAGALVAATLLWEFTRRAWNAAGRRQVPAVSHLAAAELALLLMAVGLGADDNAWPIWFTPLRVLAELLPIGLGIAGALMIWRIVPRDLRLPLAVGFTGAGLHGLALLPGEWGAAGALLAPWLTAAGLGAAAFRQGSRLSRPAVVFGATFVVTAAAAPLAVNLAEIRTDAAYRSALETEGNGGARAMSGPTVDKLGLATAAGKAEAGLLLQQAEQLTAGDSSLRTARVWRLRAGRIERLNAEGRFTPGRHSTPEERAGADAGMTFVIFPRSGAPGDTVAVHAPLRATRFETPAAWLSLEYPAALRSERLDIMRRAAGAAAGLLAAFCTVGFVLAVRQAREDAQRGQLEQARAADQAKSEFLAFLGHELRTPLQVILGRAELLAESPQAEVRRREADTIGAQGRLMLRLVNDLLDLGTVESGKLVLQPQPVSLHRVATMAADNVRAAAMAKGLGCTVLIDPGVPDWVVADEARLLQVLGNLLSNAVKYTATGGIELHVESADGATTPDRARVRFIVRDTGIGLPSDRGARLFTLFTRLDTGATFTREGTGVGLALVKRLVELMGGTVTAANRAEPTGAEFAVELQFPPAAKAIARVPEPDGALARGLRVLVAEDNPAVGRLLADYIAALGHEAVIATDGSLARQLAEQTRFDAVLLDVNLPGIDGVALARELAASRGPAVRPRLIGCSAEAMPATRAAALAAGMDDFLTKPVSLADLRGAFAPLTAGGTRDVFAAMRDQAVAGGNARELAQATLAETLTAISDALTRGDLQGVGQRAHFLRNSAQVLADQALVGVAMSLEAAVKAGDAQAARDAAAKLAPRL